MCQISYRCSIDTECISSHFSDNGPQTYWSHDLNLSWSRDVINHVSMWYTVCHFLLVIHWNRVSTVFEIFGPKTRAHTHTHTLQVNLYLVCIVLDRQQWKKQTKAWGSCWSVPISLTPSWHRFCFQQWSWPWHHYNKHIMISNKNKAHTVAANMHINAVHMKTRTTAHCTQAYTSGVQHFFGATTNSWHWLPNG